MREENHSRCQVQKQVYQFVTVVVVVVGFDDDIWGIIFCNIEF